MKIVIYKKRIILTKIIATLLLSVFLYSSCVDGDDTGSYYTFTGKMLGEYIEENPEQYSEFSYLIERSGVKTLLYTYGTYTCFLPDNNAIKNYLGELGLNSLSELTDEEVTYFVYSHLLETKYRYADLNHGSAILNMNRRYLTISIDGNVMYVNTKSKATELNLEMHNGIIHKVNEVISPSSNLLPDVIGSNEDLSLFHEALSLTGWSEEMNQIEDTSYPEKAKIHQDNFQLPKERKFGYTAFVETNELFASEGIYNIEDLKRYAASIYDKVFPADAGIDDPKNPRNSLNRFVGYHLTDKRIDYNKFIYNFNYVAGADVSDYITTFANLLLEVSEDAGGGLLINKYNSAGAKQGITIIPPQVGGKDQSAINGIYHFIDKILVYDETVKNVVLNKRIRMDAATLLIELSSNDIRGKEGKNFSFPNDYFKNVTASNESFLRYLGPSKNWVNLQGDEFMIVGAYDFTIKLPPVPQGNYELRIGFNANLSRGIAQIYFGSDQTGLQPVGIPLSMIMDPNRANDNPIGSLPDDMTLDDGYANDKLMKNKGWMKAPDIFYTVVSGANARQWPLALRRIITVADLYENETYYLRFKSVTDENNRQFHFDYLEFCPKSVYADPNGEDRH